MVVQHNITAMNSNRMLGLTTKTQAKSTEKLSSGYKVNRAADDAAGLSISEKMRKQIRGLTQASSNAQDGISCVQTAEGALNEVQDMLQRMNELAVKAANGTLSSDDRTYIQNEVDQLMTEIDRVGETTKFNETYLLKGDYELVNSSFAGKISGDILGENVDLLENFKLGTYDDKLISDVCGTTVVKGNNGSNVTLSTTEGTSTKAAGFIDLSAVTGKDGVEKLIGCGFSSTCTACSSFFSIKFVDSGEFTMCGAKNVKTNSDGYVVYGNSTRGMTMAIDISDCNDGKDIVNKVLSSYAKFNGTTYAGGKGAYCMGDSSATNGAKIADVGTSWHHVAIGGDSATGKLVIMDATASSGPTGVFAEGDKTSGAFANGYVGSSGFVRAEREDMNLHVGADATSNNQIGFKLGNISRYALGLYGNVYDWRTETSSGWGNLANVTTQDKALTSINLIASALQQVSTMRSEFGAIQNRLEHTINNLDNVVENTTAAESQIRDTDMAKEMVKYSNNNILAQAGQAMLAQSNQANQGVLSLLG